MNRRHDDFDLHFVISWNTAVVHVFVSYQIVPIS
jgi:hypothetical protein